MNREKLGFEHKDLLHERLGRIDTPVSEYTFANIYLFRQSHDYEVVFGDHVFIRGKTFDGFTYLMPAFDIKEADSSYFKSLLGDVDFFFPIPEEWLENFDNSDFNFSYNEGDTDYIYTTEKIATFKGRRLHKKRNLLKQFLSLHEPEGFALTKERTDDAVHTLKQWQKDVDSSPYETDFTPCLEALTLHDELKLCGRMYYVDGEPGGFIIGEELNEETFVLHFAKGKRKFKGLYQYMYNTFAKSLPQNYKFLNFEQDLGHLALKIAKSSYVPDLMLKKLRVGLK